MNERRMNEADASPLMSPMEAATRLGLDKVSKDPKRTILKMVRDGELEGVRVARWTMITRSSVDLLAGAEVTVRP